MNNFVFQWNCRGLRPYFYDLGILIVKHNPLAVCLQQTLTDTITLLLEDLASIWKLHVRVSGGGRVSFL